MLVFQLDTGVLCFRVQRNSHKRLFVVLHRIERAFSTVCTSGHICPQSLNFLLYLVHINIAHHNYRLIIRTIPFLVVAAQCIISKVINHCRVANHVAFCILASRIFQRTNFFPQPAVSRASRTPFFTNHTTLIVYLFGQQQQSASPVVQHEQRRIHDAFPIGRHIRQAVHRFID